MKSIKQLSKNEAGLTLTADDSVEFHCSRLLLLIKVCGTSNRIDGLTKMAKLDFFVRYPDFFRRIQEKLSGKVSGDTEESSIESPMVRYRYGPWDFRYYQALSFLQARSLVTVLRDGEQFKLSLTTNGVIAANELSKAEPFLELVDRMKEVKAVLGSKSGNRLKNLIYETFQREVAKQEYREAIR